MIPNESADERLLFPATQRNRIPIGDALARLLPSRGLVLEIASGSGEHGVTFQRRFPELTWQCSDPEPEHCLSINSWIQHEGLNGTMPAALQLDVRDQNWSQHLSATPQAIVAINLLHIAPWECTLALLQNASELLQAGGSLSVYGPFCVDGAHVSDSNFSFDLSLKQRNPSWGVRDQTTVINEAASLGLKLCEITLLPANNRLITWNR